MIRAVLDTNVVVSGVLVPVGIPNRIVRAMRAGTFEFVTSQPILEEIDRTLRRPRVRLKYGLTGETISDVRRSLERNSQMVLTAGQIVGVATHPEDDAVLETAFVGNAGYLVTGDRQLLRLGEFRGTRILSPRDFLLVLAEQDC